jgi:hypothetical protein
VGVVGFVGLCDPTSLVLACVRVRVPKGAREARETDPQNQHNPSPSLRTRSGGARDWQTRSQCNAETAMTRSISCAWCGRPFRTRQSGGRTQRFCHPACRRNFHAAVRRWGLDVIGSGALTIADIQSGPPTTRALPPSEEEQTSRVGRGSVDLSLRILPDVIEDLRQLGWVVGAWRLDDAVADAVVELIERAIALGLRPTRPTDTNRYGRSA